MARQKARRKSRIHLLLEKITRLKILPNNLGINYLNLMA